MWVTVTGPTGSVAQLATKTFVEQHRESPILRTTHERYGTQNVLLGDKSLQPGTKFRRNHIRKQKLSRNFTTFAYLHVPNPLLSIRNGPESNVMIQNYRVLPVATFCTSLFVFLVTSLLFAHFTRKFIAER